jgi:hypothetical protein
LLALLAQHDLGPACLKEALFEAMGEDAVEEAVREAEEKSIGQFGKIIKVAYTLILEGFIREVI